MSSIASVLPDERFSSLDSNLAFLFQPIAEELRLTRQLYREKILASVERNYLQHLLYGETASFIPEEFRVPIADRVAHHLLNSEGKWIRAALVLLAADARGQRGLPIHQVAVAVELVHLATLVHDDIIDQAPMRRGLPSIPGGWGNSVAVLIGDFLFSKAFSLLLASRSAPSQMLLTRATGQMCLGEIKQLCNSHQSRTGEAEYMETIENKTASLMAAAAASGAFLAGLDEPLTEYFHGYGYALGMAFQITDDVLDYTSSTSILGKEQGGDIRNGKVTLPMIHLLQTDESVRELLDQEISLEEKTRLLILKMNENGSFDYTYTVARRYGEMAKENLRAAERVIGPSGSMNSLYRLVDFILARDC